MNIVTVAEIKQRFGTSNYDMAHLTTVCKDISFETQPVFRDVFDGEFYSAIEPFLDYRLKSLGRGYKKNPNIKFEVLSDIAARTSDIPSFAKLVLEHIKDNPIEKPISIDEIEKTYNELMGKIAVLEAKALKLSQTLTKHRGV